MQSLQDVTANYFASFLTRDEFCVIWVRQTLKWQCYLFHDGGFVPCWCKCMLLRGFSVALSSSKKAEKFDIHFFTLLLKVLSKCNTFCQSWIELGIVRNNREMAFRSIIKLCYKCHPSSGMGFMHTYYYPRNSKGKADPPAWKQYNFSPFSPSTHSEPSNSET